MRFKINLSIIFFLALIFATIIPIVNAEVCSTCAGSQATITSTTIPATFTRVPTQNFMGYYQRIYKIGLTPTPTATIPTVTPTPTKTADLTTISQGGTVFIGEEGLDISRATGGASSIGWYKPSDDPRKASPSAVVSVPDPTDFTVDPSKFSGKTGKWYRMGVSSESAVVAIVVNDPSLSIQIIDQKGFIDMSGKSVRRSTLLNFRIDTNLFQVYNERTVLDGFITISVQGPDGSSFDFLVGKNGIEQSLSNVKTSLAVSYWVSAGSQISGWDTGHLDNFGNPLYSDGIYRVSAASNLNNMRLVYRDKSGTEYKGKTVTEVKKVTLFGSAPTRTPGPTTTKNPNMYTYAGDGWSIQYPYGWTYQSDNMDIYTGTVFQPQDAKVALAVYKGINPGFDISAIPDRQIEFLSNMVVTSLYTESDFMKISSRSKTTLGGKTAVYAVLGGTSQYGVSYKMKVYIIIDKGYLYIIPYTGESASYNINEWAADTMFKTFKIN